MAGRDEKRVEAIATWLTVELQTSAQVKQVRVTASYQPTLDTDPVIRWAELEIPYGYTLRNDDIEAAKSAALAALSIDLPHDPGRLAH